MQCCAFAASYHGHLEVVRLLCERDVFINRARVDDGTTPIWVAANNGHAEVVELLAQHGADVERTTKDSGETPVNAGTVLPYRVLSCRVVSRTVRQDGIRVVSRTFLSFLTCCPHPWASSLSLSPSLLGGDSGGTLASVHWFHTNSLSLPCA